jgi:hypothetical protein
MADNLRGNAALSRRDAEMPGGNGLEGKNNLFVAAVLAQQFSCFLVAYKSGAEATAVQTLARPPGISVAREVSGPRRVYRHFLISNF